MPTKFIFFIFISSQLLNIYQCRTLTLSLRHLETFAVSDINEDGDDLSPASGARGKRAVQWLYVNDDGKELSSVTELGDDEKEQGQTLDTGEENTRSEVGGETDRIRELDPKRSLRSVSGGDAKGTWDVVSQQGPAQTQVDEDSDVAEVKVIRKEGLKKTEDGDMEKTSFLGQHTYILYPVAGIGGTILLVVIFYCCCWKKKICLICTCCGACSPETIGRGMAQKYAVGMEIREDGQVEYREITEEEKEALMEAADEI